MQFCMINTEDPKYAKEKLLRWEAQYKPRGLPPGSEEIPEEEKSLHFIALEKKNVVGCAVFHPEGEGTGSVYQFTISEEYRGGGFARQMILALEQELFNRGFQEIYLDLQAGKDPFFLKMGYRPCLQNNSGEMPCLKLRKRLKK